MIKMNDIIKIEILTAISESREIAEVKILADRFNSVCHKNIIEGLRQTLSVKYRRDNDTDCLSGAVKVNASKLKDVLFSVLSQNVRGQAIKNYQFKFVKELLNLRRDINISFMSGTDRDGKSFIQVKDAIQREFRDSVTILEKIIISTVKEILSGQRQAS
jgi:hypothetical protein